MEGKSMKQDENILMNPLGLSSLTEEETDYIPLMSVEDEELMNLEAVPELLPILSLRNTVLFPGVVIPITVGRDKSIKLIKDAYKGDKTIGVVSQKDDKIEDPGFEDLNKVGTIASIIRMLRMPDGNTTVIIQGKRRFEVLEVVQTEPYLKASTKNFDEIRPAKDDKEFLALVSSLKDMALQIIKQSPNIPSEAGFAIRNIESPSFLINFISSNMNAPVAEKQRMLEVADLKLRATTVLSNLTKELQMLELKNQIQSKVKVDIDKQQRDYFLHQQLKTIQEELGGNVFEQEISEMEQRASNKKWSKEVGEVFARELTKLQRMNPNAAEYSIQTNYLETLLDLPWNEYTKDKFDLKKAQSILDNDHYGLEKVKDRILEHLAVLKLKGNMKAPILCLYGPPGVGKTSLGKSIATALGRKFIRMSLGGVHDESEIRGHRKTYIGAMPGRIIQSVRKAKSSNPVFILDEIDKVGASFHGDPSSALLEVLDPEQNNAFYDNFLEVEFDLSKVMFIATANSLNTIQPALRDRMEIIDISGYTQEEKLEIAKRHLIPKQMEEHGLKKNHFLWSDGALAKIIDEHTSESGVRSLEKQIAKVIRMMARSIAMKEKFPKTLSVTDVEKLLGPAKISKDKYHDSGVPGVVPGLAWTPVGGDILFIEVSLSKSKQGGKLTLTGNLGDVMKESAVIALEYLKAHPQLAGLKPDVFGQYNVHVHVPEGATPKDGPSAGITMLTALASAFKNKKVKPFTAMTGEITLRGKVLPVGGIKEKILAAKRAGIKDIILCAENKKDILEIKQDYLKGLTFHYVSEMHEVIQIALEMKAPAIAKRVSPARSPVTTARPAGRARR
jgi:ATP-dependent Lon protease